MSSSQPTATALSVPLLGSRGATVDAVRLVAPPYAATIALRGCELSSLSYLGVEMLDRANAFDPPTDPHRWTGRAPLLFPAVGRQRDGSYTTRSDGRHRAMPLHGFASTLACFHAAPPTADDKSSRVTLTASFTDPNAAAWADAYPFEWRLVVRFSLSCKGLTVRHEVTNAAVAGGGSMPFAIGNHITLRFPFASMGGEGPPSDWRNGRLVSNQLTHECELSSGSLLTGARTARPEFSPVQGGLPITTPCATNGVFAGPPQVGDATSAAAPVSLSVVQPGVLRVDVSQWVEPPPPREQQRDGNGGGGGGGGDENPVFGPLYFVLWGDAVEGFICPEPWMGGPDALNDERCPALRPGETAAWTFRVAACRDTD